MAWQETDKYLYNFLEKLRIEANRRKYKKY